MNRNHWVGIWLVIVSIIHTVFAVVVFSREIRTLAERGFLNSVGEDAMLGAVVWFVLFGFVLFICGLVVSALERSSGGALPKSLGLNLLGLAFAGIVLMPASGFWLILPPALIVLFRKRPLQSAASVA